MTRILVTGVAGRVGSSLALQLLRAGYDVRGMVRPKGKSLHPAIASEVDIVEASLADSHALQRAVDDVDIVVHLAAKMVLGSMAPDYFFDVNVVGTLRLLEASASSGRSVRRFVFASTDSTYGPARPRWSPITEEHPQRPGDYYGTSKVLAEQLIRNYHVFSGVEYVIARLGSVVALNEVARLYRLEWVRAFLQAQIRAGRRGSLWPLFDGHEDLVRLVDSEVGHRDDNPAVVLTGPDSEMWSVHFTDVRDVVSGLLLAIEHQGATNDEFNIVGPRTTTFAEAASALSIHVGVDVVAVQLPVTLAFEVSALKAQRRLGFEPVWDFARMVRMGLQDDGNLIRDYVPVDVM